MAKNWKETITGENPYNAQSSEQAERLCGMAYEEGKRKQAEITWRARDWDLSKEIGDRVAKAWQQGHDEALQIECIQGQIADARREGMREAGNVLNEDMLAFWLCRFYEDSIKGWLFDRIAWREFPEDKKYWHMLHAKELKEQLQAFLKDLS